MPRTSEQFEEIRNEKRKIIKDAALQLFAHQGYASTSISQIAQKADISKGLMYNYFESKEELLKTIVNDLINEAIEYLDPDHDDEVSEEEALGFIDKYFELLMKRTEEMKFFCQFNTQPEVIEYLSQDCIKESTNKQRELLLPFFEKKYGKKAIMALFNLSNALKGIMIEYVFSPQVFPDEIMIEYREYLKEEFIRIKPVS